MGLSLILGSSGAGKTYRLYKNITTMAENGGHCFAVVPEQYTMETQRTIVNMSDRKGTMNIDIVSFNRLALRIFEETGTYTDEMLDDTGKCMVLRKVMDMKKDELGVFKSKISYPGFVDEVQSLISEFYQYGIGEKELEAITEKAEKYPLLKGKMDDIRIIVKAFKEYLEGRYMIPEELMARLCRALPESEIIKDSVVTFDGFTGFTALQYNVLDCLLRYAKEVIITVTVQKNSLNEDMFSLSNKTIKRLESIAQECGQVVKKDIIEDEVPYRFAGREELAWLEKRLFDYRRNTYEKETDCIKICEAGNPVKECEYIGLEINRLVREEGLRYKDIAVITGDIEGYSHNMEQAFRYYDIPCFIDSKRQINNNPLIETIKSLLETIDNNYGYESMFRLLRCGMMRLDTDDVDRMENYVIQYGINSYKRWNQEWKYADDSLNEIKENLISVLNPVYEGMKDRKADVRKYTRVLYQFIESEHMQDNLYEYEKMFEDEGNLSMAREYSQIYGKVMEMLDKAVSLLGDEKISLREYMGILESGFQEIKVGIIPSTIDRVVVGDMERTRLGEVKVLFFAGVNDGIIPKNNKSGGILSEYDRNFLNECNIELSPSPRENAFIQKFYLYLNVTKMSEKLIVSYSRSASSGKSLRPSYFISVLLSRFPYVKAENVDENTNMVKKIFSEKTMEREIASGLRNYIANTSELSNEWKQLYSIFNNKEKLDMILSAAFFNEKADNLDRAVAKMLYGADINGSVSRLETFASCGYRHFMMYGLNLVRRKRFEVEAADIGNFYHSALELFSRKIRDEHLDWRDITEDKRKELVMSAVNDVSEKYEGMALHGTARDEYQIKRMYDMTDRTTWALCIQLRKGQFVPEGYEVRFDAERMADTLRFHLSEDENMNLKGTIDRIDIYETDENIYVKIIDYKSGNKKFDIFDVYNGLQLQLVLYMEAAIDMIGRNSGGKKVIPAGVFYYDIKNPTVSEEDEDNRQSKLLSYMKPDGIVNDSKEVISAMDDELKEGEQCSSDVIPVSYTKSGIRKGSGVVSQEEFDRLISFVHQKTGELGKEISGGVIDKNPYKKQDDKNPCEYCEFRPVCRFDTGLPGNEYRKLQKPDKEEIWNRIKEAVQNGNEVD
ncbi:MAG: helicase-exonuclease AddAB subunit AddB [Lachnospiraceae bacterium]|nr:helicase-exonuclease AddAB subunit AddB [Lachnospiraceae bacterium]